MCYIEQNPIKANMVKKLEDYPYSSYNYFLAKDIPECLQKSWIVQNYKEDNEAMKALLTSSVDTTQLQVLKTASNLIEAPNLDRKPKEEDLVKIFEKTTERKERNKAIVKAYKDGYSQHMIAKILGMAQSTIHGIIKRNRL
jgi:DNA-directed RNA polymerase specialized sigma subunit